MERVVSCPLPKKVRVASKTFKAALTVYPSFGRPVTLTEEATVPVESVRLLTEVVPWFQVSPESPTTPSESGRRGTGMKVDVEGHGRFRIGEFHAGGIGEGQAVGDDGGGEDDGSKRCLS